MLVFENNYMEKFKKRLYFFKGVCYDKEAGNEMEGFQNNIRYMSNYIMKYVIYYTKNVFEGC